MLPRRMFLGLAAGALAVASPRRGLTQSAPALAPDIKRIRDRGRLLVATTGPDAPPFVVSAQDGAPAGTDIELARGMARALGVAVAFDRRAPSADEAMASVARHDADLAVARLSETLERALLVRFSRPYLVLRQALLLNRLRFAQLAKGRDPVEVAQDPGAPIAVVSGSAYVDYARRLLPRAALNQFPRWEPELLRAVQQGEVLAGYGDELQARRVLAAAPEAPLQLRLALFGEARDPIGVALPWDSTQLLAWIDLYLETQTTPLSVEALLAPGEANVGNRK